LEAADWSRHTKSKQKRQNWTGHSYFLPVLISAGGLINEHNMFIRKIAPPKNDLTTVFVAQRTDPPIKNGVILKFLVQF